MNISPSALLLLVTYLLCAVLRTESLQVRCLGVRGLTLPVQASLRGLNLHPTTTAVPVLLHVPPIAHRRRYPGYSKLAAVENESNIAVSIQSQSHSQWLRRLAGATLIAASTAAGMVGQPGAALAASSANTGKSSKTFELCLSKCIFAETKPPPLGSPIERLETTRPREEILRDCKSKCAVSKEQLMLGKPKASSATQEGSTESK